MSVRSQLHDLIRDAARQRADGPALTFGDLTLTYGELWERVLGVGAGLQALNLRRGDRVAVYLDKRIETVSAIFGTSVAGGVFVPINPLLRPRQVGYIAADCDARVVITTAARYATLRDEIEKVEHVVIVGDANEPGTIAWADLAGTPRDTGGIDADMAAILYTSGSTGSPKGVVLSHRNLLAGAESVSSYLGNGPHDVILAALPLSFDAGFSQLTTAFHSGAHAVLLNYLLPADVVRACAKHGVTGLTCVPPLWIQIADVPWPPDVAGRLRYFANTGGRMPKTTLDKLRTVFPGAEPYLMYGLTEAFRSTYLDPAEVDRRPDSIGKAIPNAEVLVVRPDGVECEPGEEGELVHRGALVAMGYWNDPERTAVRFRRAPAREPGLCTAEVAVWSGDVVVRDDEGFLYFVGRKDEMIKTSGYRVSPTEIEEVAYNTGLIRDAAALAIPDPKLGQAIVLAVAGGDVEPDALLAALRKELPLYMVPRRIVVRAELPRSPNGKFDRNALREELA